MSGDVGTSSPMPRATKRGIERTWAVEGLGPAMFSLRIATDQRWTRLPQWTTGHSDFHLGSTGVISDTCVCLRMSRFRTVRECYCIKLQVKYLQY